MMTAQLGALELMECSRGLPWILRKRQPVGPEFEARLRLIQS